MGIKIAHKIAKAILPINIRLHLHTRNIPYNLERNSFSSLLVKPAKVTILLLQMDDLHKEYVLSVSELVQQVDTLLDIELSV